MRSSLRALIFACATGFVCAGAADQTAPAPSWASATGGDRYGTWADVSIAGVTQRFRLIPPGHFIMGSSEAERAAAAAGGKAQAAWMSAEVQHPVTLTRGFWMADSACTQALWQAVMGANPSNFSGDPQRPVEQVSWDDCQRFLAAIAVRVPGAELRLPSEAEWEYACRAGTSTATYAGDLAYLGAMNAPALDAIAWYGGNSGVGAEVLSAIDSSGWDERQYASAFSATHPVKRKLPNAWGLYDMLGDVWVWCSDWYGDYPAGEAIDPHGPASGTDRVSRGGSWGLAAWYCRAAERIRNAPASRWNSLGLRLCATQQP